MKDDRSVIAEQVAPCKLLLPEVVRRQLPPSLSGGRCTAVGGTVGNGRIPPLNWWEGTTVEWVGEGKAAALKKHGIWSFGKVVEKVASLPP